MYRISEEIAALGKRRIEGYPVEGFVWGSGPTNPALMLVGEAPGENELETGIPFTGRAGKELMASLQSVGLSREDVYITSAVRSRPYKWGAKKKRNGEIIERKYNRAPTKKEIIAHAPILDAEIRDVGPPLIVTLGNIGLQRLIGPQAKVTELHGVLMETPILRWNEEEGSFKETAEVYHIFPTFHPASVFYNPSVRALKDDDWRRLKDLLGEIR
ncbi:MULTISPECIES: uracil-DNA glycosylase [Planococcus]|uniref:Uracil-DNA glycosylase n=1 Tax=Planococcus wigleyi TaxID=2762216 RepID=A0ABR8WEI7_9BACL|nr:MULTISPECIES: uracil-DNA glycosylase [Planococcus]MBD8015313.1 uracil-DNA glycosylase [Planococcus wigleyi]MDN3439482.1 uracil-DNA glycosylase [Planococcus sp. APC 3900]